MFFYLHCGRGFICLRGRQIKNFLEVIDVELHL